MKIKTESGFTVLEIALSVVVVGLLGGVGFLTYQRVNNQDNRNSTASDVEKAKPLELQETEAEDSKKVDVPNTESTAEQKQPSPPPPPSTKTTESSTKTESKPSYTSISLTAYDADINESRVKFKGALPGNYSGKCYFTIKNLTTSTYVSKEVSVNNDDECQVEVPKSELSAGSYKYYITFKNNEYTVKGSSDYKQFNL